LKGIDLQGLSRLITDATIGITNLVEEVHKRVVHPPFLPSTPIQHLITDISGIAYKNIRWSTKTIGGALDKVLGQIAPVFGAIKVTKEREAAKSVLNGILGDFLEKKDNPLKINMQFRYQSKPIKLNSESLSKTYPTVNGKVLLMVHGSCMNDIQWTRKDHNHGTLLAKELDKTPVYLHYNSGLHISSNGKKLNNLLEALVQNWPVPIEDITIISHSMGGLIVRSAIHYGENKTWTTHLKKIVFLGTPHHGSPLERIGNYFNFIIESIPYAKPFAQLGKVRSAEVTDLRYGNIVDEDWLGKDRFAIKGDQRQHIALPEFTDCYSIAAVIKNEKDTPYSQMSGDRLVDIKSALGEHKNPSKNILFNDTYVAYENNHLDLLNDIKIYAKLKEWLT